MPNTIQVLERKRQVIPPRRIAATHFGAVANWDYRKIALSSELEHGGNLFRGAGKNDQLRANAVYAEGPAGFGVGAYGSVTNNRRQFFLHRLDARNHVRLPRPLESAARRTSCPSARASRD